VTNNLAKVTAQRGTLPRVTTLDLMIRSTNCDDTPPSNYFTHYGTKAPPH